MASIEKRGSAWRVKVRKGGISRSETFTRKADALAWAAAVEAEIAAGKVGKVPNKSFGDLLRRYAEEITPSKRGARPELLRINRILQDEKLAGVRLPDLGPEHFAAWRDRRLAQVSSASVLREWAVLTHACNVAIDEWRWLVDNPIKGVGKPAQNKARNRRVSDDEVERVLLACGYDRDQAPVTLQARVGAVFLFALETAMRAGEICGLRWEHVDEARRVAHLPLTKNGHARDVPLSREALRLIAQMRPLTEEGPDGRVWKMAAPTLDALFRKAKTYALMQAADLHFHDTRHEALTRMAAKVDVMTLAKISGHRDLRILLNTYYHPDIGEVASLLD